MINNIVSIKIVLQEIIRDLGLGATAIPVYDIKEWIIEALKHIGAGQQFKEEIITVEIKAYSGVIPCEVYKIKKVMEGWKYKFNDNLTLEDIDDEIERNTLANAGENDYKIEFNQISTAFETGSMKIKVLKFPVDAEGYLMVPDSVSYKDALMWKIAYQLGIQGYAFRNPLMSNIEFTGRKWQFYCKQARGGARMGDARVLQAFGISMNKLVPDSEQYNTDFEGLNRQERVVVDPRAGNL